MKILRNLSLCFIFMSSAVANDSLRTGDIILQPLKCWSCTLIEEQEESSFSHIGIVVEIAGELEVAEAYGEVKLVSLNDFLKKSHPEKSNKYIRVTNSPIDSDLLVSSVKKFIGNPYDRAFRWNNFIDGREAIYCSELVYKVLNPQVKFGDLSPKRMLFDINPELWDRYFQGNTPRGELGISPEDFNESSDFTELNIKE